MTDRFWMRQAYELALQAKSLNEVPVGAVLVGADNQLLGQGYNCVIQDNDPCGHAEIIALRNAAALINNYRLNGTTLYVTLEPCPMCAGALVHARVDRIVFATRDLKTGAAGSVYNLLQGYPLNHKVQIDEGILQSECAQLLSDFFQQVRI